MTIDIIENVENVVQQSIRDLLVDIEKNLQSVWTLSKHEHCEDLDGALRNFRSWLGEYRELVECIEDSI